MDKAQYAATPPINQSADDYFAQIKKSLETSEEQPRELTVEEEKKMHDGFALDEMTKTAGWKVVSDILTDMSVHTWVSPIGMDKEAWMFAELNAFHMANNAKELLNSIKEIIYEAHELQKEKVGEKKVRKPGM